MRRTELKRRTPLKAKAGLSRAVPAPKGRPKPSARKPSARKRVAVRRRLEPGEATWKARRSGTCAVCGKRGRVVLHHLTDEQTVRRATSKEQQAGGIVWNQANALMVGAPFSWGGKCRCHLAHHHWSIVDTRIPFEKVSPAARRFAAETLGEGPAEAYFRRHYRGAP